ncbi:MAG: M23 family metallopeptidase [Bacteroides sp.]|nr:M23 family metallopeptidase [Bacteroides sp.]MCM1456854.1 M23 family metallopeptidase [Lachnoclostridium sp.]
MRKTFYKYNPATASYERVYPSRAQRWWAVARQFAWGVSIGLAVFVALYFTFDFPREKELRIENEHLHARLAQLGRQADEAMAVMEDIAARDNNFYRVMMQADPMTPAARYAGLERQSSHARADSLGDDALVNAVGAKLDRLDHQVYAQIKSFDFLYDQAHLQRDRIDHMPAIQPVSESKLRQMASGYGYRRDPIYGTSRFHEGMDFSSPIGTPVYATGKGIVVFAGWKSGYGNLIEVDHGYNYVTRYAHLSKIGVKEGQAVDRGEQIGEVGNTGKSTGPHLHYEVRLRDQPQNPVNYYFYDLTPEEYDEMIRQAENAGHVMD